MTNNTVFLILLAAIIALMMAFFQYYYKNKNRDKVIILLTLLRFFSIFFLLVLLINPKIKSNIKEDVPPLLNVLVDNSTSMAYAKAEGKINTFIDEIKTNTNLTDRFDIDFYAFADKLYTQDTFAYNISETNITDPLQKLHLMLKDNVTSTILITDGNQTKGINYAHYRAKNPIYPVVVGDTLQYDDLRINQINVNSYANLNNNFPVEVFLSYKGTKKISHTFAVKQNGNVVFKKLLTFSKEQTSQKVQFNLKATTVGVQNFTCTIAPLPNEKNVINNQKNFSIEVIDEQSKILVLSEVNHPDIGMLRRSIGTNKQHEVSIQNNLNNKYQYQDYQLVIIYQPNNKFKKIFEDIELAKANVFMITGPVTDWNFLNDAQPFFSKEKVSKIENYVPFFNTDYSEFITEDINFSEFTPIEGYFGDIEFKVPHQAILYQSVLNFETENPLLATFTLDDRRGALLLGSNSWKWRMQTYVSQNSFEPFDNFFNKLIQYLSSNKKYDRLEVDYQPFTYANQDVVIKAQFFDATYVFDNTANLVLSLTNKLTKENLKIPFTLRDGHYEAIFKNLKSGDYRFSVQNEDKSVVKYGNFSVLPYDVEQQLSTANTRDLKLLAESSNGFVTHIQGTDTLIDSLLTDNRYKTVQRNKEQTHSLIHWKWLLGLIMLFFTLEWFVRKYYGKI